jgi:outer membrane protein assembly factor BamA
MRRVLSSLIVFLLLFLFCQSGIAQSQIPSTDGRKILVDSFVISGTRAIDAAELAEITGSIAGSEFDNDPDEMQERVRDQFQNHGYFQAEVSKFEIKVIDPLASPKLVRLEADVNEGPLCRLSTIDFTGNHFTTTEELRAMFPLKAGDVFEKAKIGGGLESMMKSQNSHGFLDFTSLPNTTFAGSVVKLDIEIQEGPQYRMGKLEVTGPAEGANKLQARWTLDPGAVFDRSYIRKFLEENSSLLPADFVEEGGIKILRNCPDSTVSVHIHLVSDPQHDALDRGKQVDCKDPDEKKKK